MELKILWILTEMRGKKKKKKDATKKNIGPVKSYGASGQIH